jgi:hypothetical protein
MGVGTSKGARSRGAMPICKRTCPSGMDPSRSGLADTACPFANGKPIFRTAGNGWVRCSGCPCTAVRIPPVQPVGWAEISSRPCIDVQAVTHGQVAVQRGA